MNPTSAVVLSVLLSAGTAATIGLALKSEVRGADPAPVTAEPDRLARLERELGQLREQQTEIARSLESLSLHAGSGEARVNLGQVEELVERALERRASLATASEAELTEEIDGVQEDDHEALFASLFGPDPGDDMYDSADRQAKWKEIAEAGLAEEAIAWFESQVEANPNDPDQRVELGEVYLFHLQEVGNGPMAGVLATKADQSFDAALDIDPNHWDARFTKAVALSFWPPVFGKQGQAIQQFEMLVEQQGGMGSHPSHAQTHLLLGNMYQQLGQQDKARAAWQLGSERFPENQDIARQLALSEIP